LAIEGGTNRVSRQAVTGVGAANREQIEKAFFRALTVMLPSSATYALVRDTTIQASRDLYGSGSVVERAITQAWDAVGVQDRLAPVANVLPNPATSDSSCNVPGLMPPTWPLGATVSAGNSNLRITQWTWDFFDHTGRLQDHEVLSPTNFAQYFNQCGPGSSSVLAQSDTCAVVCVDLRGDSNGTTQMTFTATTDAGQTVTFSTPRVVLQK